MSQLPDVSIVTPTFNEHQNVPRLYELLAETLVDYRWELIVVDDNSPDRTWEAARALREQHNNLQVMRRVRSRGLSSACIEGVQMASGKYTVVMDADLQHDETKIPEMLERLKQGADLVIGSRFADNASAEGLSSKRREMMSRFGNLLSRIFIRQQLTDPLTGFFALRTEDFLHLTPRLSDSGFKILVDLLIEGHFPRVEEVGFQFRKREAGYSKLDRVILWQFGTFLIEKMTRGLLPARFVSFAIVGGSGVFVHFATLFMMISITSTFWIGQLVATLVAMTSNFFFNNWLTFRDKRLHGVDQLRGLVLFALFASVGIIGNVGVSTYIVSEYTDGFSLNNSLIVAAASAGIIIDTLWKFVMSERFVWKKQ